MIVSHLVQCFPSRNVNYSGPLIPEAPSAELFSLPFSNIYTHIYIHTYPILLLPQ